MLPIELLVNIVKLSRDRIALNIIIAFNVRNYELFIDMLVEKHSYGGFKIFTVYRIPHNRYGPAIEYRNGTKKWYYRGKFIGI